MLTNPSVRTFDFQIKRTYTAQGTPIQTSVQFWPEENINSKYSGTVYPGRPDNTLAAIINQALLI